MNSMFHRILQPSAMMRTISGTPSLRHIGSSFSLKSQDKGTTTQKEDKLTSPLGRDELSKIVKTNKVVIFMKGNPQAPRCGFSNAVVQILRMHGVKYDAHDVLKSDDLRQGIKEFSDWPTIPQIYINGKFVGGCDILLQMHQSGELVEQLQKVGIESSLLKTAEEIAKPRDDK